jgi:hypothetical protein
MTFDRRGFAAVLLLVGVLLTGACSSSSGTASAGATRSNDVLATRIASTATPFETGQKVGLGEAELVVDPPKRTGSAVTVTVRFRNLGRNPIAIGERQLAVVAQADGKVTTAPATTGAVGPNVAAGVTSTATLRFSPVPPNARWVRLTFHGEPSRLLDAAVHLYGPETSDG